MKTIVWELWYMGWIVLYDRHPVKNWTHMSSLWCQMWTSWWCQNEITQWCHSDITWYNCEVTVIWYHSVSYIWAHRYIMICLVISLWHHCAISFCHDITAGLKIHQGNGGHCRCNFSICLDALQSVVCIKAKVDISNSIFMYCFVIIFII